MPDTAVPAADILAAPSARAAGALLYVGAGSPALGLGTTEGFVLYCAAHADAALAVLDQQRIDLIVCDLRDPGLDGVAFLESARLGWPRIARLALGPAGDAALLMAALNRGGIACYLNDADGAAQHAAVLRRYARIATGQELNVAALSQFKKLEALRESARLLDDIVDNLPISVQLKSIRDDYRIVLWNKAAEQMYGVPREEALGRNVHELWPHEDADRMHASDLALVAGGGILDYADRPARTRHRDQIRVHMRKVPIHDAVGNPTHVLVIADDITARLESDAALLDAQARFQRALDGAQDGLWEFDLRDGSVFMSERMRRMLGCGPGDLPKGHDATSHLVHPDDLPSYRQAYVGLLKLGETLQWEGRFRQPDGGYRWFRVRGVATMGPDGRAILASGTTTDIDAARRAQDELRRHRDDLAGLVEERTAGLTEAMQAAERANLAKSEFLANMSHELRTPMHAIISFANFGVEKIERVDPERLKGYFLNIQKSAGRLLGLLNDLLDLSKLEAGKMEVRPVRVNAADLMRDAMLEAEALAEDRHVEFRLAGLGDSPAALEALWDGPRVLQVLRNLLSNALKFSPPDSVIELSAQPILLRSEEPDATPRAGIEFCVRDQGPGIPPDELEVVFDKFVQSSKTKTGAGGTGLGLAICREIIAAHQGSIHAEQNAAPQAGVSFIVRLPAQALGSAAASECSSA